MGCCFCVSSYQVGIVENCGKFSHTASPGCGCIAPCCYSLRAEVPLCLQIAVVTVESKTSDNAVVSLQARLHYRVVEERAVDAFYRFTNPSEQIGSFAAAIVRGEVPKYTLDELFLMSDQIKKTVETELTEKLLQYGFTLQATLLTRIDPTGHVKQAISLTQVNAYKRTAAEHEAELNKVLKIKEAEADFEEKRLSGLGLALERKAIMGGLSSSIEGFVDKVPGMNARDVMNLLLLNQYFDSMKEMGANPNNRLVMLPGGSQNAVMMDMLAGQIAATEPKGMQ